MPAAGATSHPSLAGHIDELPSLEIPASLQTWKYVEGMHSALQEEFAHQCRKSNPGMHLTVLQLKLLSNPTYADVHTALKRQLHGSKGEV
jgi:hypothetical protein